MRILTLMQRRRWALAFRLRPLRRQRLQPTLQKRQRRYLRLPHSLRGLQRLARRCCRTAAPARGQLLGLTLPMQLVLCSIHLSAALPKMKLHLLRQQRCWWTQTQCYWMKLLAALHHSPGHRGE